MYNKQLDKVNTNLKKRNANEEQSVEIDEPIVTRHPKGQPWLRQGKYDSLKQTPNNCH